jgi:hypothetical protein
MGEHHKLPEETPQDPLLRPLSALVSAEAQRVLSQLSLQPDPELVAQGWERRFITDKTRLQEVTDLYRELGFQVLAVPLRPEDLPADCDECQLMMRLQFQTLYTRRPPGAQAG